MRSLPPSYWLLLILLIAPLRGDLQAKAVPLDRRSFESSIVTKLPPGATAVSRGLTGGELASSLEFEVALQMRDYSRLIDRIGRGVRVPREEMEREHLPKTADHEVVVRWLSQEGFVITGTSENRLAIFAKGTIEQIQKSFQVKFRPVILEGNTYLGALDAPSLPKEIAGAVLGINGLQPFLKLHKHSIEKQAVSTNQPPYLVSDILGAYNATNLGVTGSGQKIAILIDTFPANSDVSSFWTNNNIPQSLSNLEELNVNNATLPAPSGEETLDVEWSSGIAPGAKIRVYAAGSLAFSALDKCLQQLIADLPSQPQIHQLSISLGLGETYLSSSQFQTDSQYFATLANNGVSIFVSSGDAGSNPNSSGATGGPLQVEYYSSDPSVTGVGGTSLLLNTTTGAVSSENAWSGSGGGSSVIFSRPSWQTGTGVPAGSWRLVPDVSLVADPNTGAYVFLNGSVHQYGGTSWSTPVWAGFSALINEARQKAGIGPVGLFNPNLYPLVGTSNFRDITSGNNGNYSCTAGYDEVTGLGSPNVTNLLQTLVGQGTGVPSITGFTPTSGLIGSSVVINGLNLGGVTGVKFNGTLASFVINSGLQLTATVPAGATSGLITVTNAAGSATSSGAFNVVLSTGTTALYSTGFETAEGYPLASGSAASSSSVSLSGTKGWTKTGTGGQGLLNGAFPGSGQQGYIGFTPPSTGHADTVLWTPTAYVPVNGDIVRFSVQMDILDSTNSKYDLFYWSLYNAAGTKLCSVFFNNGSNAIGYLLDNGSTVTTGTTLVNGHVYQLQMDLNLGANTWNASLDGNAFVNNQQITAVGSTLTFGYVAAIWHRVSNNFWGNNYMVFDNYSVGRSNPTLPMYTVAVSPSAASLGSVAGSGTFFSGDSDTVTATSGTGAAFVKWLENGIGVSGSSNYTFTLSANRNLVAAFQPQNFGTWKTIHFTTSEQANATISGPMADPDGDGIVNLIEYACNLDPKINDASNLPAQTGVENGYLTLTYPRNDNASDLTFLVEVSSDLVNWSSGPAYTSSPTILSDDGFTQVLKVSDLTPSSSANKRFIRLKVIGQ